MIAAPLGHVNASLIGIFMIERPGVGHRRKYIIVSRRDARFRCRRHPAPRMPPDPNQTLAQSLQYVLMTAFRQRSE
jgi:hypothetical protein